MYLHLGDETVINSADIVGIFDIEKASTSKITKDYLKKIGKNAINVSMNIPKSFVVCDNPNRVYITQISSKSLQKRAKVM